MERKRGWGRAAKKERVIQILILYCTHVYLSLFHVSVVHLSSIFVCAKEKTKITSCMAMARQHARPSHKHCKACANHAHAPPPRDRTCLRNFHLLEFSYRPVPSQSNNELKQQGDGAGETSRTTNYELQGTGLATRAPVAQTLQSVRQTCSCATITCSFQFARFPSCGIFTPTRAIPVKQQVETTVCRCR